MRNHTKVVTTIATVVSAVPVLLGLVTAPRLRAQASAGTADRPAFEVASIKPNRSGDNRSGIGMRPGRFTTTEATARMIIEFAYNLKDVQISGGPDWINSEKNDIDAKEEGSVSEQLQKLPPDQVEDQVRLMVQSLLANRFALKVHHETRELPVYALVLAKNGPKLTQTTLPPIQTFGDIGAGSRGPQGFRGMRMERGRLTAVAATMSILAGVLSRQPEIDGRVFLDQTGLKGSYDFTLQWTPDQNQTPGSQGPDNAPPADSSGPSLFTAIQDQLGLKVEAQKGPVDVLVIDHIEEPSPN